MADVRVIGPDGKVDKKATRALRQNNEVDRVVTASMSGPDAKKLAGMLKPPAKKVKRQLRQNAMIRKANK
jgi:hypothetical protein